MLAPVVEITIKNVQDNKFGLIDSLSLSWFLFSLAWNSRQEPELSQDVDDLQEHMLRDEDVDKSGDEGDRDGVTEPLMPPYSCEQNLWRSYAILLFPQLSNPNQQRIKFIADHTSISQTVDGQCAEQESLESRDEVVQDADAKGANADVIREGQEPSERSRSSPEGLQRSADGEERGREGG